MSIPRKFIIGMKLLRDIIPIRISEDEKTGLFARRFHTKGEEVRDWMIIRDIWISQFLKSSEKLSKLFSQMICSTCKPLHYLFIEVSSHIVDLHPDLASKVVIEPLINSLNSVIANVSCKSWILVLISLVWRKAKRAFSFFVTTFKCDIVISKNAFWQDNVESTPSSESVVDVAPKNFPTNFKFLVCNSLLLMFCEFILYL